MASRKPSVEIVLVTPTMAAEWLAQLGRDRTQDQLWIDQLAQAMRDGLYTLIWDAVAFDTRGRLRNGQHRLAAIVQSGVAQTMIVVRGIPADALLETVGDQGRKRSFRQILEMRGESDPGTLAPATRYLWQWLHGFPPASRDQRARGSATLFDRTLKAHPQLREHASRGRHLQKYASLGSSGLGTLLCYLLLRTNSDEADVFLGKMTSLDGLQEHDPILVLHGMLVEARGHIGESKGSDVGHKYAWVVNAYNLWLRNEPATKRRLRWNPHTQALPMPDAPGVEFPSDLRVQREDERES